MSGSSDLVEYVVEIVLIPRMCQLCWEHEAVFFLTSRWPFTWMCRRCIELGVGMAKYAV